MASILFLGYSNLIKVRILPILTKVGVTELAIAKYAGQEWDDEFQKCGISVTRYDNYEDGLENYKGELVYISTVNSTHVEYARKSIEAGYNTIIDKPATMNYQEARELVALAKSKKLFVGESTVYLKHPQLSIIRDVYKNNSDEPKLLTVHFTMPPFMPDNFRYQKSLGGGAIMDTAPYAVSIGRYFFGSKPEKVTCIVSERQQDGLDIEYSLIMSYPDGKTMIGHFGFNTEYINQVYLIGSRTNILVNRIFTIPDNLENELQVRHNNKTYIVKAPSGNNFEIFLREAIKKIEEKKFDQAYHDMLWDAEVKDMILECLK